MQERTNSAVIFVRPFSTKLKQNLTLTGNMKNISSFIFPATGIIHAASSRGGSRKFRKRGPSPPLFPPNENFTFQEVQHTALWAYS